MMNSTGRQSRRAVVAWLAGVVLLTGCGDDSDPSPDYTTDTGGVSVACAEYDPTAQVCQVLEVVRSGPQGQVQLRTTIDLRSPTLEPNAVTTTLDDPAHLSRLLRDMQNPSLNVVFDSHAQRTLQNGSLLTGFEQLARLHPDHCQLVHLRSVSIPVCT